MQRYQSLLLYFLCMAEIIARQVAHAFHFPTFCVLSFDKGLSFTFQLFVQKHILKLTRPLRSCSSPSVLKAGKSRRTQQQVRVIARWAQECPT